MVKQEPEAYSWDTFVKDGSTAWTGVRNFQARNNLRAMRVKDLVLYYHSVTGKAIVGIAEVIKEAYPDPTAEEQGWDCVDLKPSKSFKRPVTLAEIKEDPHLKNIPLVRQSRLSVMPLTKGDFDRLVALGMGA